jgi:hypothetical protein
MLYYVFALSSSRLNNMIVGVGRCSREAFAMYIVSLSPDHNAIRYRNQNLPLRFGLSSLRRACYKLNVAGGVVCDIYT